MRGLDDKAVRQRVKIDLFHAVPHAVQRQQVFRADLFRNEVPGGVLVAHGGVDLPAVVELEVVQLFVKGFGMLEIGLPAQVCPVQEFEVGLVRQKVQKSPVAQQHEHPVRVFHILPKMRAVLRLLPLQAQNRHQQRDHEQVHALIVRYRRNAQQNERQQQRRTKPHRAGVRAVSEAPNQHPRQRGVEQQQRRNSAGNQQLHKIVVRIGAVAGHHGVAVQPVAGQRSGEEQVQALLYHAAALHHGELQLPRRGNAQQGFDRIHQPFAQNPIELRHRKERDAGRRRHRQHYENIPPDVLAIAPEHIDGGNDGGAQQALAGAGEQHERKKERRGAKVAHALGLHQQVQAHGAGGQQESGHAVRIHARQLAKAVMDYAGAGQDDHADADHKARELVQIKAAPEILPLHKILEQAEEKRQVDAEGLDHGHGLIPVRRKAQQHAQQPPERQKAVKQKKAVKIHAPVVKKQQHGANAEQRHHSLRHGRVRKEEIDRQIQNKRDIRRKAQRARPLRQGCFVQDTFSISPPRRPRQGGF